jgi:adenylate cyclase
MTNAELERAITAWLVQQGLEADDEAPVLEGLCERLVAGGVPLWRAATGAELLHPLLDARGCRWRRGQGMAKEEYRREGEGEVDEEAWRQSPFYHLVHRLRGGELRRRLDPSYRRGEFPLLDAFQDEGATDYLAFSIDYGIEPRLGRAQGLLCSFQTDRPGGFREEEAALLRRLAPVLALAFKAIAGMETARTLATTYLGEDAGRRVLDGAIARGVAETVRAILWYSDLRGFTRLADTAPRDVLIALLNTYADAVVSVVHAHGG